MDLNLPVEPAERNVRLMDLYFDEGKSKEELVSSSGLSSTSMNRLIRAEKAKSRLRTKKPRDRRALDSMPVLSSFHAVLGIQVYRFRISNKLSKKELGAKFSLSTMKVAPLERGSLDITLLRALEIIRFLGLDYATLEEQAKSYERSRTAQKPEHRPQA